MCNCSKCGKEIYRDIPDNEHRVQIEVLSKCCNSSITVGTFASECDNCGNSVDPDTRESYNCKTSCFGGIN